MKLRSSINPKRVPSLGVFLAAGLALPTCGCVMPRWVAQVVEEVKRDEMSWREPSHHPIGACYEVVDAAGTTRQITVYFNGRGLARILDDANPAKIVLNFADGVVSTVDQQTGESRTQTLDPSVYPVLVDPDRAPAVRARCIGGGVNKSFPYRKWARKEDGADWEVWIDDHDRFPVYFRGSAEGKVTQWRLLNSWIDPGAGDREGFFELKVDPPPPEKVDDSEEMIDAEPSP